jgi:hypothetical protein
LSQLKKGAFLAYVKIVLTNVIGLILRPYIVRNVGESEYGVYFLCYLDDKALVFKVTLNSSNLENGDKGISLNKINSLLNLDLS